MSKDAALNWDLELLNKAYRQGYMAGVMGMTHLACPYRGEVVTAAWEAGWDDGRESLAARGSRSLSLSRGVPAGGHESVAVAAQR